MAHNSKNNIQMVWLNVDIVELGYMHQTWLHHLICFDILAEIRVNIFQLFGNDGIVDVIK